jgi:type II secretory pathway component PulJ
MTFLVFPFIICLFIIFLRVFLHVKKRDRFFQKPGIPPRLAAFLFLVSLLAMLLTPTVGQAQSPAASAPVATPDQQTMQALLDRIDQLEARVQQLEAAQHPADPPATSGQTTSSQPASFQAASSQATSSQTTSAAGAPQHGPALPPPVAQAQSSAPAIPPHDHEAEASEHSEYERMDLSKTLLRIRGFGDVDLRGDNYHPAGQLGDTTSFSLGELNLFVTSDISDRFHFLSEIVFEAGPDNTYGVIQGPGNEFGVDIERYLLTYSYSDYFNLSAGRYHTAIGYYNTAFHHSTWLQTTTGRPLLFAFEDSGGILPIHNVGVEAYGRIPSGSLGLHYVAEIGNGRESRMPLEEEPVQNVISDKNHKAVNFEVFARPTKFPGLQTGFSIYRDLLIPAGQPVGETILAAHAVYTTSAFEWLNEALVIRHTPLGGRTFATPGWYSQISHRWGQYRPYFRYQYINASSQEPIFPDIQLRAGPSAGLRYDANESVALKLQYDYTALRNEHATQGLEAQIGFTF